MSSRLISPAQFVVVLYALVVVVSSRRLSHFLKNQKRDSVQGNPCPEAESPFPCRGSNKCIPLAYLCDDNQDCDDWYDEDADVCTASKRVPVGETIDFLTTQKSWIMPNLFADRNIEEVAHALTVSPTVNEFKEKLDLTSDETSPLCKALDATSNGHNDIMEQLGMPSSSWNSVVFFFSKLIKSGFTC